ncbi:unnamed protein product [Fusarium graminearum]|nr:unnamed protein product [Fusarium graminearum]
MRMGKSRRSMRSSDVKFQFYHERDGYYWVMTDLPHKQPSESKAEKLAHLGSVFLK